MPTSGEANQGPDVVLVGSSPCSTRHRARLQGMIPSYGESLVDDVDLCRRVRAHTATVLQVNQQPTNEGVPA
jgi:hypothetical protein